MSKLRILLITKSTSMSAINLAIIIFSIVNSERANKMIYDRHFRNLFDQDVKKTMQSSNTRNRRHSNKRFHVQDIFMKKIEGMHPFTLCNSPLIIFTPELRS